MVTETTSIEEKFSTVLDTKNLRENCISLMKQLGLLVLTLNMTNKNHHVTEVNKHQHKLVAKNEKIKINLRLKNWKRLEWLVNAGTGGVFTVCKNVHGV
jgi:hypothetical protein